MSLRFVDRIKRARVTFLVAAGLACVAPAHGATYHGSWDPAFGSAFPDLGWRGEATFFVPDACLAESGWVFNFESCSNGAMKVLNAEVDFFKLSDPTNPAFQETLEFADPTSLVERMRIENGTLTGLFATFDYFVASTLPLAGGPYTDFVLLFVGDVAQMGFISHPPDGDKTRGFSDLNPPDGAPFITFQLIPEPGGVALALLALLAIASIRMTRNRGRAA